jgi:hypothetical protein
VFDVDAPGPGPSPGGAALTLSPAPAASLLSRLTRVSLRMCLSLTAVHLTSPLPSLLTLDLARCSSLAVSPLPDIARHFISARCSENQNRCVRS